MPRIGQTGTDRGLLADPPKLPSAPRARATHSPSSRNMHCSTSGGGGRTVRHAGHFSGSALPRRPAQCAAPHFQHAGPSSASARSPGASSPSLAGRAADDAKGAHPHGAPSHCRQRGAEAEPVVAVGAVVGPPVVVSAAASAARNSCAGAAPQRRAKGSSWREGRAIPPRRRVLCTPVR